MISHPNLAHISRSLVRSNVNYLIRLFRWVINTKILFQSVSQSESCSLEHYVDYVLSIYFPNENINRQAACYLYLIAQHAINRAPWKQSFWLQIQKILLSVQSYVNLKRRWLLPILLVCCGTLYPVIQTLESTADLYIPQPNDIHQHTVTGLTFLRD